MKVTLLTYTPKPIKTLYLACRTCYSETPPTDLPKVPDTTMKKLISKVVNSGHLSVLEPVNFTFAIEGVSRVLTHQLVRSRTFSFSQQSQRYVKFNTDTFEYVTPPTIRDNTYASQVFKELMDKSIEAYNKLIGLGIHAEDARFTLPNAACSNIIVTADLRNLINFMGHRLCNKAQWEIRELADLMKSQISVVEPFLSNMFHPKCMSLQRCNELNPCGRFRKE
jgi:thymidylate synthase (FAD)